MFDFCTFRSETYDYPGFRNIKDDRDYNWETFMLNVSCKYGGQKSLCFGLVKKCITY